MIETYVQWSDLTHSFPSILSNTATVSLCVDKRSI